MGLLTSPCSCSAAGIDEASRLFAGNSRLNNKLSRSQSRSHTQSNLTHTHTYTQKGCEQLCILVALHLIPESQERESPLKVMDGQSCLEEEDAPDST